MTQTWQTHSTHKTCRFILTHTSLPNLTPHLVFVVSLNEISTFDSKTSDVSSSHTFISFWPPHTHKTHNTQTVLLSASECFSLYLTNSGVHTEQRCTPVSTLLSKKSGSTLRCEWRCALLSLTYILPRSFPSQYTNTIPRPAVWCGNSVHISCQPERFLGLIHELHGWGVCVSGEPFWIWEIEAECDSNLAVDKRLSDSVEEEGKAGDMICCSYSYKTNRYYGSGGMLRTRNWNILVYSAAIWEVGVNGAWIWMQVQKAEVQSKETKRVWGWVICCSVKRIHYSKCPATKQTASVCVLRSYFPFELRVFV